MPADRAAEMRAARELFQLAMREGISMEEAKTRRAADRHAAAQARLAAKQRCGTSATGPSSEAESERRLPYYQQGQYA